MIPCWKAIKVQYQQKNKSHLHRQVLLLRVVLITRLAWTLKTGFFQPSMYSLNPPWPTHLRFSTLECSITDKRQWITYKEIKGNYWHTKYIWLCLCKPNIHLYPVWLWCGVVGTTKYFWGKHTKDGAIKTCMDRDWCVRIFPQTRNSTHCNKHCMHPKVAAITSENRDRNFEPISITEANCILLLTITIH